MIRSTASSIYVTMALTTYTCTVNVSVFVNVNEFGHWVCGESWHATKDL